MIRITRSIAIDENEIREDFVRASGPGGQNVNKVATAVQLRFDVTGSPSLPPRVRRRLTALAGRRMSRDGILIIQAGRFRTQEHNRRDAMERLIGLIRRAALKPKVRWKTKPPPASRKRRLESKRRRGRIKRLRQSDAQAEE